MEKLVTIIGGSGFIGRYIAQGLAQRGYRVRIAVRRPNEALFTKTYGVVGQVEPLLCNIRDDQSVRRAIDGAYAVVNCVGTFDHRGKNNFDAVQHLGAERVARISSEENVERLVHISAIGADVDGGSAYARSKGEGEKGILVSFPSATILRPSVVFGPEDEFFNRFAGMARLSPMLPLVGAKTKFQPVYVEDVALAATVAVDGESAHGIFELGGPDVATFRELMERMLNVVRRRRLILDIPLAIGGVMGTSFDLLKTITGGLIRGPITADQVRSLREDSVVSEGAKTFANLGIEPVSMDAILPGYLWRFRPSGQYDEIKQSAKQLRSD